MRDCDINALAANIMEGRASKAAPEWDSIADSLINAEDMISERDLVGFGLAKQQAKKVLDVWLAIPAMERFNMGMRPDGLESVTKIVQKAIGVKESEDGDEGDADGQRDEMLATIEMSMNELDGALIHAPDELKAIYAEAKALTQSSDDKRTHYAKQFEIMIKNTLEQMQIAVVNFNKAKAYFAKRL